MEGIVWRSRQFRLNHGSEKIKLKMKTILANRRESKFARPRKHSGGATAAGPSAQGESTPQKRKGRRWPIVVAIMGLALIGTCFGAEAYVASILRGRLQAAVSAKMNADLELGRLWYHFPYGVTATDAKLVMHRAGDERVELLRVGKIDLTLREFPGRNKPVLSDRLTITRPTVHLVKTPEGIIGEHGLFKSTVGLPAGMKASKFFRLGKLVLSGGEISYEDRTQPGSDPIVCKGLNFEGSGASTSRYDYRLKVADAPLANVSADGTFDVDDLALAVKDFALAAHVSPEAHAKLPAPIEEWLRTHQVRGAAKLSGHGEVALRNPALARYDAVLDVSSLSGRALEWDGSLDRFALRMRCAMDGAATQRIAATIEKLDAASGEAQLTLTRGIASLNFGQGAWTLSDVAGALMVGGDYSALPEPVRRRLLKLRPSGRIDLTATAQGRLHPSPDEPVEYEVIGFTRDFKIHPDKYPLPIEHIKGGPVRLLPGLARGESLEGNYGVDHLFLAGARIPIGCTPGEIHFDEIHGTVDFAGKPQPYPLALNKLFDVLRPGGAWTITGNYILRKDEANKYEFHLGISSDHAVITPAPLRIPVTDVRCDITCDATKARGGVYNFPTVQAVALGGPISGTGQIETGFGEAGKMLDYRGVINARNLELRELAQCLADCGKPAKRLSGLGFVETSFSGTGPYAGRTAAENLRANGEFEIVDGDFWEIPVIKDILADTPEGRNGAMFGEAAGTFQIRNRIVELSDAAISAPVLGLQGRGGITFDGDLDLRVVAAPLADWKQKLRRTGIPLVSDVTGEVAGAIQSLLNGASKIFLYEFRIGGRTSKPQVMTVPAPVLSDTAAAIFGQMITPARNRRLIDAVKETN
jgi:hypothetical protein